MNALVSIVIPCYNAERTIARAIESCLQQTYDNLEVVVIDDASKDLSPKIVAGIAQNDHRVRLHVLPENKGVSHARNIGIKRSSGLYFSTLDSDDYYDEDKIRAEVLALESGEYIASFSNTVNLEECSGESVTRDFPALLCRADILTRKFVPRDFLIRRDLVHSLSLEFDEDLSLYEDWDWKVRIASLGLMVNSNSIGTYYIKHNSGLSSVGILKIAIGLSKVFFMNSNLIDLVRLRCVSMFFNSFLRR